MTNRMTCPLRTKHSPPMRCAPGAEHPGRWCAGRNDEGTIGNEDTRKFLQGFVDTYVAWVTRALAK